MKRLFLVNFLKFLIFDEAKEGENVTVNLFFAWYDNFLSQHCDPSHEHGRRCQIDEPSQPVARQPTPFLIFVFKN